MLTFAIASLLRGMPEWLEWACVLFASSAPAPRSGVWLPAEWHSRKGQKPKANLTESLNVSESVSVQRCTKDSLQGIVSIILTTSISMIILMIMIILIILMIILIVEGLS